MENRHLVCNLSINGQLFIAVSVYQRLKQINQPFYGDALRIEMFFWGCKKSGWWCTQCRVCRQGFMAKHRFGDNVEKPSDGMGYPIWDKTICILILSLHKVCFWYSKIFCFHSMKAKTKRFIRKHFFSDVEISVPSSHLCMSGLPQRWIAPHPNRASYRPFKYTMLYDIKCVRIYIYNIELLYLFEISYTMSYWHLSTTYEVSNYQSTFS